VNTDLKRLALFFAPPFLCGFSLLVPAQDSSSTVNFTRDVFPILHNNCVGCHSASQKLGGLSLESHADLMKGGARGAALTPGDSAKSRLILMIEGKIQPRMPLKGELTASEIATLKRWIDAGAPVDETISTREELDSNSIPDIKPKKPLLSQVSSLAFSYDDRLLAVAGYKQVQLFDVARGSVATRLTGPSETVRSLAYSPDGRWLAAAGGDPAKSGEIILWHSRNGEKAHTLKGHDDYVYSLAFSPDSKLLATGSYDKTVILWDVTSGNVARTLKDHTDAVYPVTFSPDGKLLATGSADRTVKIWDVATGKRLFTLSDALDAIYTVAFSPSGSEITASGADKVIRTWTLSSDGGNLTRSIIAHEDSVIQVSYSPDGRTLASTAADRLIKIWDLEKGSELRVLERQPDWGLSIAFSHDGSQLAVGRYDGSVSIYDAATGRRKSDVIRSSSANTLVK
jgi:WD40 repeat protein